jgi:hypothetical protein
VLAWSGLLGEWRNRQTRTVQVRVSERTWGFNSPLAHHIYAGQAPPARRENWRLLPNFYRTMSRAIARGFEAHHSLSLLSAVVAVTYVAASIRLG